MASVVLVVFIVASLGCIRVSDSIIITPYGSDKSLLNVTKPNGFRIKIKNDIAREINPILVRIYVPKGIHLKAAFRKDVQLSEQDGLWSYNFSGEVGPDELVEYHFDYRPEIPQDKFQGREEYDYDIIIEAYNQQQKLIGRAATTWAVRAPVEATKILYVGGADVSFLEKEHGSVTVVRLSMTTCDDLCEVLFDWRGGVLILDNTSPELLKPCLGSICRNVLENGTGLVLLGGHSSMGAGVTRASWEHFDEKTLWILPVEIMGQPPETEGVGDMIALDHEDPVLEGVNLDDIVIKQVFPAIPMPGATLSLMTLSPPIEHPVLVQWPVGSEPSLVFVWCSDSSSLLGSQSGKTLLSNMVRLASKTSEPT